MTTPSVEQARLHQPHPLTRAVARCWHRQSRSVSGVAMATALALGSTNTQAATFDVTNLNATGPGSFIQALADAQGNPGPDTILFDSSLSGTIPGNVTTIRHDLGVSYSRSLVIRGPVRIVGPGADKVAIVGQNSIPRPTPAIYVTGTPDSDNVVISGFTIKSAVSGIDTVPVPPIYSGHHYYMPAGITLENCVITGMSRFGVERAANLVVRDSQIVGNTMGGTSAFHQNISNSVITGNGKGIEVRQIFGRERYIGDLTLNLENAIVSGNTSSGVAFWNDNYATTANVTVRNSTISNNGGNGIYTSAAGTTLSIATSTISSNVRHGVELMESWVSSSGSYGSAQFRVSIADTTIAGNTLTGFSAHTGNFRGIGNNGTAESSLFTDNTTIVGNAGGGIKLVVGNGGQLSPGAINHTTIAGNVGTTGGGISVLLDPTAITGVVATQLNLDSTIIAKNAATVSNPDLFSNVPGFTFAANYSLVQKPASASITTTAPGSNITGKDPRLSRIADFGGGALVRAPLAGSPAINAGNPAFSGTPANDQRGAGFPRVAGGRIDIGAVEQQTKDIAPMVLFALNDMNSNGTPELAAMAQSMAKGTTSVRVRDALTKALITRATLVGKPEALDMQSMRDVNANGKPELAVLRGAPTTVSIVDGYNGSAVRTIAFTSGLIPQSMAIAPDMNGNGKQELAVLATKNLSRLVEVRDGGTGALISSVTFDAIGKPNNVVILPDMNGNGMLELAVLFDKAGLTAPTDTIQIRDAATGTLVINVPVTYTAANNAQSTAMAVVPDLNGDGNPELAVLGAPSSVTIYDAKTGVQVSTMTLDHHAIARQFVVMPDTNANGSPDIAVLVRNQQTGALSIETHDAATGTPLHTIAADRMFRPDDLAVVSDMNGNGVAELAHSGVNATGVIRSTQRDAVTGAIVTTVNY